jgi:AcrR family transcriptional regulator
MVRWQPGTLERLQLAAIELFEERGYDGTTVADIAARAGLTERTFYRHFTDKREVLVSGSAELTGIFTNAIADQPHGCAPLAAVSAALLAVGAYFDARRPFAVRRAPVIAASPALRERELAKLDALTASVTEALRRRGTGETTATLVATLGVGLFHVAFGQWLADPKERPFGFFVRRSLTGLHWAVLGPRTSC